ncbi:MAG: 50S ribosomal protein L31e [Candidatus Micrarchaeota archaeon]
MAGEVERVYTIPFRKAYERKRTARAVRAIDILKKFLARHMKTGEENVRISKGLNELIWARGIQKPPRRVKALVKKDATGKVFASLVDEKEKKEAEAKKEEKKKEKKEKKTAKAAEKPTRAEAAEAKK